MPWQIPTGVIDGVHAPVLVATGNIHQEIVVVDNAPQFRGIDYTVAGATLTFLWVVPLSSDVGLYSLDADDPDRVSQEAPTGTIDGVTAPVLTCTSRIFDELINVDYRVQVPGIDYRIAGAEVIFLWVLPLSSVVRIDHAKTPGSIGLHFRVPQGEINGTTPPTLSTGLPIEDEVIIVDRLIQVPPIDYSLSGADIVFTWVLPADADVRTALADFSGQGSDTSGELVHNRDHVGDATALLLQQYRDATVPGLREQVQADAAEVQNVEDATWSILDNTAIDSPSTAGVNLDRIGGLVGQARGGMDDGTYLLWLTARISLNKSSGSINDVLRIFTLLNPGADLEFAEQFPAAFALRVHAIVVPLPEEQAKILDLARKAGVRSVLEYSTAPTGDGFTFAGGDGKGFPDASLTPGSGGKLAGALA